METIQMMNISRPWFYCLSTDVQSIYFNATSALSFIQYYISRLEVAHSRKWRSRKKTFFFMASLSTIPIFLGNDQQHRSRIAVPLLDQLDRNQHVSHVLLRLCKWRKMGAVMKTSRIEGFCLGGGRIVNFPIGGNKAMSDNITLNLAQKSVHISSRHCLAHATEISPKSFLAHIVPAGGQTKLPISSLTHMKIPSSASVICASI